MPRWRALWRLNYPRPEGAECIGTAAVVFLRGNRARESDKRAQKRREQDERQRRTGYVGSAVETAQRVRSALRLRGRYSLGCQEYGAQLVAHGRQHNFQGQFRLAQLTGVVRRTVQRYRAQLEADGLIVSQLLHAGDMIDGMRAPTSHVQVVRDVSGLLALASAQPKRRETPRAIAPTDAIATPAPSPAADQMSAEEIARFVRESLAEPKRPITERPTVPVPPGCPEQVDPSEIDRWEREWDWLEWRRQHERPPPD